MSGGAGNDSLSSGAGNDSVSGGDGDDTIFGGPGNDTIDGGAGNDFLGGGLGVDSMAGGAGNDTYVVDSAADTTTETLAGALGGIDTIQSSVSRTLGGNFENLTLTGGAGINGAGNGANNVIIGNNGANVLNGFTGSDSLRGLGGGDTLVGGEQADVLVGGLGADTFDFNLVTHSTAAARDSIQAGDGAIAFEGAGIAGGDRIDLSTFDANLTVARKPGVHLREHSCRRSLADQ